MFLQLAVRRTLSLLAHLHPQPLSASELRIVLMCVNGYLISPSRLPLRPDMMDCKTSLTVQLLNYLKRLDASAMSDLLRTSSQIKGLLPTNAPRNNFEATARPNAGKKGTHQPWLFCQRSISLFSHITQPWTTLPSWRTLVDQLTGQEWRADSAGNHGYSDLSAFWNPL